MLPVREWIDKALNWSGGAYVGLSTLTVLGLAIAEYSSGAPVTIVGPDGKNIVYLVHHAPDWLVGPIGLYTVILALFWAGKPINTYIAQKGTPPPDPAPAPAQRPMEK